MYEKRDFSSHDLKDLTVEDCVFASCCFDGALLENLFAPKINFVGSTFLEALMKNSFLNKADMWSCDFSRADMSGVKGLRADFHDSQFISADLSGSDLSFAGLLGADFTNANLDSCSMRRAAIAGRLKIRNCNVRGIEGLDELTIMGETVVIETSQGDLYLSAAQAREWLIRAAEAS